MRPRHAARDQPHAKQRAIAQTASTPRVSAQRAHAYKPSLFVLRSRPKLAAAQRKRCNVKAHPRHTTPHACTRAVHGPSAILMGWVGSRVRLL